MLPMLPTIAETANVDELPVVVAVLGVTGAITRILAAPGIEAWLTRFFPWLAADPDHGRHHKDRRTP